MNSANISNSLIFIFGGVIILIYGKSILFPFLFALLIYFLIRAIIRFIDRSRFIKDKIPSWIKNLIASIFIFSLIVFTGEMLIINSAELANSFVLYQSNIDDTLHQLNNYFGVDITGKISENLKNFEISKIINPILNSITLIMSSFMMALFYLLFLFIEESNFKVKLHVIFSKPEKYEKMRLLLINIEHSITHYIGLKTLTSFISATIAFIAMISFGLDSPLFWAFIVFIMNFIPVIGAFLVTLLPSLFALMQFGSLQIPLILFFVLGIIQTIIGNVLEPKLMGDSLNISPLAALISLAFWGAIWGITGMIVSVPITVICIILMAQFPKTQAIAVLLSRHGKI